VISRPDLNSPCEALWIQHLKESREAVGMPVVRCRREEQPMLEALGQFADGFCKLA